MSFGDFLPKRRQGAPEPREQYKLSTFQRRMNDLFDDFFSGFELTPFGGWSERFGGYAPKINLTEDEKQIKVTAELPGMQEGDIELSLTKDSLTLRGEKRHEEEKKEGSRTIYFERSFGSFQRVIPLTSEIDEDRADASFKNGVLTVLLPKSAAAAKESRKISIRNG